MSEYFPIKDMSDEFLVRYRWYAQETQDGRLLKLIEEEIKQRYIKGE
jgi:hypothetical protein